MLQNIAVAVHIPSLSPSPITFCSIYIPASQNISTQELSHLISSLPPPFILCGDFNAHSPTWGCNQTNSRGNIVDNILLSSSNLILLDNLHTPTHLNPTSGSLSHIDLTLSSPILAPKLNWLTNPDLCDSDHFPIILKSTSQKQDTFKSTPRWIPDKADWPLFYDLTSDTSSLPATSNIPEAITSFTEFLITAAQSAIPLTSGKSRPHQVPWWSPAIKTSIQDRKKTYKSYRRSRSQQDFILYKKARAKTRVLIRSESKWSWNLFISSINQPVPNSTMWSNIKRLTGNKSSNFITEIESDNQFISDPLAVAQSFATHYSAISADSNFDPIFFRKKSRRLNCLPSISSLTIKLFITTAQFQNSNSIQLYTKILKIQPPALIAFTPLCSSTFTPTPSFTSSTF